MQYKQLYTNSLPLDVFAIGYKKQHCV